MSDLIVETPAAAPVTPPPAVVAPPNGAAPVTPAAASVDWGKLRDSLPEDLRKDPNLGPITSLEGLAKSFVHAQKNMGNRVPLPDKHATPEDWKSFSHKLGNPEKIDDYKINLPTDIELDPAILKTLTEEAHSKGILPWQFEAIMTKFFNVAGETEKKNMDAFKLELDGGMAKLKAEWGQGYDAQVKRANAAFKTFLPDEADRKAIVDMGLGGHPAVVKLLAQASKLLKDDDLLKGGAGASTGMTKEDALKKARDIQGAGPDHPYRNKLHPNHANAQEEVRKLYEYAYTD